VSRAIDLSDLAGPKPKRVNSAVWLPPSARAAYQCRVCGAKFTPDDVRRESHIRHVVECARRHADKLAAASEHHNAVTMDRPEWADLEYEDWIRARARECAQRGIEFDPELETKAYRRRKGPRPAVEFHQPKTPPPAIER